MNTARNLIARNWKTACLLSALVALLFGAVSFHSMAQSTSSKRKLTPKTFKDAPIVIHQVRNLDKEKDWFRDLEIEVKNVSDKPIYFISLGLEFPDIEAPPPPIREDGTKLAGSVIGFSLTFGNRQLGNLIRLATPEDISLKPGEIYVFTIPEARVKGLESMRKSMKFPPEATNNIIIRFNIISFGDGTGFEGNGFGGKRDYRDKIKKQPSDNQVFQKINWNKPASTISAVQSGCGDCLPWYIEPASGAYCIASNGTICERELARTAPGQPCSRAFARFYTCGDDQPCYDEYINAEASQSCPGVVPTPSPTPTPTPTPVPTPTPGGGSGNGNNCTMLGLDGTCPNGTSATSASLPSSRRK